MEKKRRWPYVIVIILQVNAILCGVLLGKGLAGTKNAENTENFTDFETALPTRLLDINGEVITEFASDEKREIIALDKLPQHMIDALLTREDRIFYVHHGFSAKAVIRAFGGKLLHLSLGGGSTLTQQIAGTLYCDRTEMSITRKIKELWWAVQMERRWSKNEILELYLNKIYFGGGTYGVNAASKYYFGHPATDITPAEAAILVIQLSNPAYYNPFDYPNRAMDRQQDVLNSMVKEGYLTREDADNSFNTYWSNFDYTRTNSSAYAMRDDKAPWFSEYVRRELGTMLYGSEDIYTSGFTVNTTLNLTHQKAAEEIMADYIASANRQYQRSSSSRQNEAFRTYVPMTELLCLVFNLPSLKVSEQRAQSIAMSEYTDKVNPVIDVMSLLFGMDTLKTTFVNKGNTLIKQNAEKTTIEGTMISIENSTGYINALVGGSKYDQENQFIRAVQAKIQPGSTFKPLYYSAAIDSQKFTMTSTISDTPVVFHKADGTPYIPQNFKGEWEGNVQLWYALAHSMNVPSLKVLDGIGFDAAIKRTSALLGIPSNELAERHFDPVYPLGLGVCSVRPIEMARAFSIFAMGGKETIPMAIRTVEDKNGIIKINPEKDIRDAQAKKGSAAQIISPQTAFIMDMMLEKTVESGTLSYGADFDSTSYVIGKRKGKGNKFKFTNANGKSFYMPVAGKTGTTQNWADAWTVGFTPYYTAAFWFGFDKPGQSLGLSITGSTLAGVAWGDFMHIANDGLPYKDFPVPADGIVRATVCSVSGQILTSDCGDHRVTAYYLAGTQPTAVCEIHSNKTSSTLSAIRLDTERIKSGASYGSGADFTPLQMPSLDFLNDNYTGTSTSPKTNSTPSDGTDTDGSTNNGDNQDGNWLLE
jgi:penicillin-binding protein 1A